MGIVFIIETLTHFPCVCTATNNVVPQCVVTTFRIGGAKYSVFLAYIVIMGGVIFYLSVQAQQFSSYIFLKGHVVQVVARGCQQADNFNGTSVCNCGFTGKLAAILLKNINAHAEQGFYTLFCIC